MGLPEPGKSRVDRHTGTQQYFFFNFTTFPQRTQLFLCFFVRNFNFKNPFTLFAGHKNTVAGCIRGYWEKLLAAMRAAIP